MPSNNPQFNRRLPRKTVDEIERLSSKLNISQSKVVEWAIERLSEDLSGRQNLKVAHLDNNPENNDPSNLRFETMRENK